MKVFLVFITAIMQLAPEARKKKIMKQHRTASVKQIIPPINHLYIWWTSVTYIWSVVDHTMLKSVVPHNPEFPARACNKHLLK
jgi:hypothetical protein